MLQWTQDLSTNIDRMDQEHIKLIDLMNRVEELIMKGADRPQVKVALGNLIDYTKIHFRDEEAFMEEKQCPSLGTHKLIHQDLLEKAAAYQKQFLEGGELGQEFFHFLKVWLVSHIKGLDKKHYGHL